jgi:flagellar hook protein FlgE
MLDIFSTALSALRASGTAIEATGHNLANLNTNGFKASNASFREMVAQSLGLVSAPPTLGGVEAPVVRRQYTQGSVQITNGPLDAAIQGDGFFAVKSSRGEIQLTRDGSFRLDSNGFLVTNSGQRVQGWVAAGGVVSTGGTTSDIQLPSFPLRPAVPSTSFGVVANLDSSVAVSDPNGSFSAPVQVIDSLGTTHTLSIVFTKTGSNAWDYEIFAPGEDLTSGTAGTPTSLAQGSLTFDAAGRLTSPTTADGRVSVSLAGLANGAADMDLSWNLYDASGASTLTQFDQPSAISETTSDGSAAGQLSSVSLADGGRIVARYSSGEEETLAVLALASIRNPDSLIPVGDNNLQTSVESGAITFGAAGTGGRGDIVAGALEGSNVDMARELTNIILYQRTYQANARVVTTVQELTQEVLNIKR